MAAIVAGGISAPGAGIPVPPPRQALELTGLNEDEKSVAHDYDDFLAELTVNSKLVINNLTKIAEENSDMARPIGMVIMSRLSTAIGDSKLPLFYLLDSITKNVGKQFIAVFRNQLSKLFLDAYPLCSQPVQGSLQRMLGTWGPYFGEDFVSPVRGKLLELATTIGKPIAVPDRPSVSSGSSSLRIPAQIANGLQPKPPTNFQNELVHQRPQQAFIHVNRPPMDDSPMASLERETENLKIHIATQFSKGFIPTPEQLDALGKLIELQIQMTPDPSRQAILMQQHQAMIQAWKPQPIPQPAPVAAAPIMQPDNRNHRYRQPNGQNRGGQKRNGRPSANARAQVKAPLCSSLEDIGKVSHKAAVNLLYDDLPLVNVSDGMRFKTNAEKAAHLDWRFAQNKRNRSRRNGGMSRCWYSAWDEWLNPGSARGPEEDESGLPNVDIQAESDELKGGAVAGDDEKCPVCGEGFELSWSDDKGAWIGKDAWRDSEESPVLHVQCMKLTSPTVASSVKTGTKRKTPESTDGA